MDGLELLKKMFHCFFTSANSNRIIPGWDKGERVALKIIPFKPGEIGDEQIERYWENLIKLRDDNLVQYRSFTLQNDGRYLAMELCQGSMLDYCRGTLDSAVASIVKAIDIMWQITCAVEYLDRQKIGHGDLKLESVLFKTIDSEPRRVVAKLSGYGYNILQSGNNVKTDFSKLGFLYISAATKKEIRPSGALATWNLTEIDIDAKKLALELINLVTNASNPFTFEAGTLLRHPFFIRYCQFALPRLIKEQTNEDIRSGLNNHHNLEKWRKSLGDGQLPNENFSDLKKILLSDDKNLETALTEASKIAPQLLAQYIWHLSTTPAAIPKGNDQKSNLEIVKPLGEGSYGRVYECYYTNKDGIRFPAACKIFKTKAGKKNSFDREIATLSHLNHLFIIKYLDVVEMDDKKYMVMELCEGSLKEYVEGKLEQIPQNSLDDKIIISQLALGLAYIHRKGIVHKDLTLENILLKRPSPESHVVLAKIADFVLARELRPDASEFSVTKHLGTETYMAPELLKAPKHAYPANFATDIYAFGIIIARIALKGDHPFTSDRHYRFACMAEGLVPPKLQHLSWDLIDLIVKLTDKDPAKRPVMGLVLYHPYFVLTNDKTKRHFVDHLWAHINSKENKKKSMKQMFNNHNFQGWYNNIMAETSYTVEEIAEREKTLRELIQIQPDCTVESLYGPAEHYRQKIQNALKAEYNDKIGNQINRMFSSHALFAHDHSQSRTVSRFAAESVLHAETSEKNANSGNEMNETSSAQFLQNQFSRKRLHNLVQSNPALLVSYFSFCLFDVINNKPANPSATATNQQKPIASGKRKYQLGQFKRLITKELQWINLFYDDDEQIADELWNMKYPEINEIWQDAKKEIIRTAAKCNISTAVWSKLLNWIGTSADSMLLHEVVQSHVPNAPKIAEMILQKLWFKEENLSSFHLAAYNEGNYADEIMKVLFDYNRIPTVTEDGLTPAHIAAQNESNCGWRLLKLLLDNNADPNASFQNGTTPVHWAAMNQGNYAAEILKYLLDHGGDSEKIDKNGLKPIHYATLNTNDFAFTLLDVLLKERGANVTDSTGRTLLHFAVSNEGDHAQEILNKLLENKENPNVGDNEGRTPLHLAISDERIQQVETIRLLLRYPSDPNAVDQSGLTPVHYATASENEYAHEKLKLLLACKGNLTIKDKDGLTPIHYAIMNKGKCGDEMRKLVGVNPEKTNAHLNSNGEALLHHLVGKNKTQLDLVQMVIDSGGDPNATDKFGRSPVHSVVLLNESLAGLDILRLLLAKGGNVNLQDKGKQFTPVHYVASSLKLRVPEKMKILLNSGGNVNTQGNDGITPLHLAVANPGIYGPQLTRMLLEFEADANAIDAQQRTPLHVAIRNENDDISFDAILQLIEKGANPNAPDIKGWTPVHYAIQHRRRNSVKVVNLLLQHGGSMKIKDNKGMTPQRLAEHCLPECLTADKI
ncbi:putative Serine/threonine-protein kinase 33 [Daphnia magna]|uniref:Putative Serine/threonine-protein kinase 33 n=1 Tax=Daphnia magna TaxID=35525 RepID=A0A162NAG3_9CRUS|nr:putative Serine/threonine-protein kinase 33 [Daphnia magna]